MSKGSCLVSKHSPPANYFILFLICIWKKHLSLSGTKVVHICVSRSREFLQVAKPNQNPVWLQPLLLKWCDSILVRWHCCSLRIPQWSWNDLLSVCIWRGFHCLDASKAFQKACYYIVWQIEIMPFQQSAVVGIKLTTIKTNSPMAHIRRNSQILLWFISSTECGSIACFRYKLRCVCSWRKGFSGVIGVIWSYGVLLLLSAAEAVSQWDNPGTYV